jgi:S-phase kinase-associated protein 1
MSDDDNSQVIVLAGSGEDAGRVTISRKAACMSELLKSMLADDDDPKEVPEIPLLDITKDVLDKVVEFLNRHKDDPLKEITKPITNNNIKEIVSEWDAKFVDLEQEPLFRLILAANYLDIPSLLDLGICKLACMVKGKEPDEVKKMFNIEPDITPEEEKLVRDQNPWIFDITAAAASGAGASASSTAS